jgi:hemoglobin
MFHATDIRNINDIMMYQSTFIETVLKDYSLKSVFMGNPKNHCFYLNKSGMFWYAALFGSSDKINNPFCDFRVSDFEVYHFKLWIFYFNRAVDKHFEGPMAENAKCIAAIFAEYLLKKNNRYAY